MKSKKRQSIMMEKRERKKKQMQASGESNYARKAKYCDKHGCFGFEVPEPKPWKSV